MRWNQTIRLIGEPQISQDEMGNVVSTEAVPRTVFCNPYTVGASAWAASIDLGLRADAEVEVRTVDYDGENTAVYDGTEYTVERIEVKGDITRLQLGRMASNG